MKLATLADGTRDGRLLVVDRMGQRYLDAAHVAPSLQAALDDWQRTEPELRKLSEALAAQPSQAAPLKLTSLAAPLPRAYEWVDGSAFLSHVLLVRKARGAAPPDSLEVDPLVYQGGSGVLLAPCAPLVLPDEAWGLDLEGELCVVLGDTPRAVSSQQAGAHVRLMMLANDVTYRHLVPAELAKNFGFFQSKPATAFAPFALTPDELGGAYRDGRVHLRLRCYRNGELLGDPNAGEMHFSFFELIAHLTKTRAFTAGTILGSGTVANSDPARGVSCLAERRARETIEHGSPRSSFLKVGERVRIEMLDEAGVSLFGAIDQEVVSP